MATLAEWIKLNDFLANVFLVKHREYFIPSEGRYKNFAPQSIISPHISSFVMRLPTGCNSLDTLLGKGIESGIITEFFGEGGSGKTNICLQLAKNVALKDKKTIFIDTEGVSVERLEQISGERSEKVMENTIFFKPHSFSEQEKCIKKGSRLALSSDKDFNLFIVDSFTTFYRSLYNSKKEDRISSRLGRLLIELMRVARKKDIPVVITTQVYESDDGKKPVGGHVLYHNAKTIVLLEVLEYNIRKAVLEKHRSLAKGKSARFKITENGIVTP